MRSGWSRSRRGASQALLQRLDLLGNGGLGEITLLCGLGKAAALHYREEIFELPEQHGDHHLNRKLHGRDSPHGARHGGV